MESSASSAPGPPSQEAPQSGAGAGPVALAEPSGAPAPPSQYESEKRRDWNTFLQYLNNHKPPLTLARCSGAHVIEFLKYLDRFGKTKVHMTGCEYFGNPNQPAPCSCPLRQAWGSLDALIGRLTAAYEENGGTPESNPFGARAVRIYLREVREVQAKARGIPYEKKKKRKRVALGGGNGGGAGASGSGGAAEQGDGGDESQKRGDWNTFLQYLNNHKPPLTLARCSGAHVVEFLKYLDQFGKTKVHVTGCVYFGNPNQPAPCSCPLRQALGSLHTLIGRLRAAYEENGGGPESNPFGARAVRIYLREVRDVQAKARGMRKRVALGGGNGGGAGASGSGGAAEQGDGGGGGGDGTGLGGTSISTSSASASASALASVAAANVVMNRFHFKEGFVETYPPISITRHTSSCSYVIESEVYARDCEKQELIDPLINFENTEEVPSVLPVVGVGVGMGGIGKTTLARLVFHDERIIAHFHLRMWVSVTEADSDVPSLMKKILDSAVGAYVYHPSSSSSSSDLVLQTKLQEKLHGKRYLLVLDGVWNEERYKWNRLKACLKCGAMGSRILVTTCSDTVASITGTRPRHDLGRLSAEQSWSLFQKLAKPDPDFLSIGKEMVDRCGGDVLAVKTLGGLMFTKTTKEEWESVRSSDFWKPQANDGGILPALKVSYDHLTSSLKQCFVYCAVFPKGHEIDKSKLIKQWIAHGFIHSDEESELLEEKGECYFNDLLQRSLFQVKMEANGIDVKLYKMHDCVHDFLRYLAGNEYFTDEASMEIDSGEARHLVLQNCEWVGEPKNLDTLKTCSRLRSMFLCFPADIDVCLSLTSLRVLDLSFAQIKYLPGSIGTLKHLRYLDVSSKWLTKLPENMSNLHCLQTLICLGSPLRTLPVEMRRMISLRHIEFDAAKGFHLPSRIGQLTCLRTLPKFVVGKRSGCGIEELKCLNQLSGDIRIERLDMTYGVYALEANLKGKQHLNSLELSWPAVKAGTEGKKAVADTEGKKAKARKKKAEKVIENLQPHSNLKKLIVENYPGLSFPSWMMILSNLVDIKLLCNGCEHLPPLGQLCFLESLTVEKMSAVKYVVEFDGSHNYKGIFPSLRELYLCDMPNLEGWLSLEEDGHADDQGIDHLRHLTIYNCPNMIQLPQLHLLTALECLKMNGVGCARIKLPLSQSLKEVALSNMCNLERCSVQEANGKDNNDQVIFRSLYTLSISNCPQLTCLPWLRLPALEYLMMTRVGCEKIEFCTSPSLKSVSLANMPDLEHWSPQKANDDEQVIFPRLKLEVQACPRMVCLPNFLSSVKEMRIYQTNELLLKSLANFTGLAFLSIRGISEVTYLPKELGPNHASLRILEISDCPKLMSLSYQLKNLPTLKELTIEACSDLVLSLADELQEQHQCPPLGSLEVLKIVNSCEKQASIPGDGIILTSLRELNIRSCGNLESLSSDGLQNLTTLTIFDCPRVWSSPEWLRKLRSLSNLIASRCPDMMNLPESIGNLTSLSKLWIEDCPGLRSLPESLGNLRLLETVTIANCPQIACFPQGLQHLRNLRELSIDRCPNLNRVLCENGRIGEDWPKVARLLNISIDGLNIRDYLSREESSGESEEDVDDW